MSEKLEVKTDEVKKVLKLFEDLNAFFHSAKTQDIEEVGKFTKEVYPRIKEAYYETVWDWLPQDIQRELMEK